MNKVGCWSRGKPGQTALPAPFHQVPGIRFHEIHHKYVVCGFNGEAPTVYCGSSNLAEGGERDNGDNLLAIRDADVATAFVIETLLLVDHYDFLDRLAKKAKVTPAIAPGQQAGRRGCGRLVPVHDRRLDRQVLQHSQPALHRSPPIRPLTPIAVPMCRGLLTLDRMLR